ncbi:MAG TPA: undecaprenyl-diphosphate phosphatase [Bryobacteraceae bacterium]|nr:undecaprenyl-diphosphate phosphatase [Bryobacteraceae bacterium]
MNDYFLALILGVIEGLTEFLPVSSTAHLRIAQALLGIDLDDGYWKMFSIVIQLGAILCLPIYFRRRIASFFATFPKGSRGDRTFLSHPLTLTAIAFICTAGPAFVLIKVIGKNLENLVLMGVSFIVGGIIMWVVDAKYGERKSGASENAAAEEIEEMGIGRAVFIGLCQVLAPLFPGTSRSMATIAAGQIAGLSRTAALEFSFLLSIPTLGVATAYDFLKFVLPSHREGVGTVVITSHQLALLAIGFIVSFFVAWAVVAWFMNWVRNRGFVPFAVYRLLLGTAVLIWAFNGR